MGADGVKYAMLKRSAERRGYRCVRVSGSHHIWTKAGCASIPIPVHGGRVKHAVVFAIASHVRENDLRLARGPAAVDPRAE